MNYAYYAAARGRRCSSTTRFLCALMIPSEERSNGELPFLADPVLCSDVVMRPAGERTLSGSLADLPYVLAQVEQNFIVPENVQALIWEDLVPSLLASAVLPRWWG